MVAQPKDKQTGEPDKVQPTAAAIANTLLIVESPVKATKIQKYLGSNFKVLASQGHIRDLVPKAGSVDPSANFKMKWAVAEQAKPRLDAITHALQQPGINRLILATDPDREGEAIAWHLSQVLAESIQDIAVERVTFTEVTNKAVQEALQKPRQICNDLVESYKARRALDFLVGFGISPILWSKMVGSKSAGRVQSVALRLIAEREAEREAFKPNEWWTVDPLLTNANGKPFRAQVTHVDGNKVQKLRTAAEAQALADRFAKASLQVTSKQGVDVKRSPSLPFITSSMLTAAASQLGSDVARTMANAQVLFEGGDVEGLISYMRTDSPTLDKDLAQKISDTVAAIFGDEFVADALRLYKGKGKNAQEGHGAIAPVDPMIIPEAIFMHMGKVQGAISIPTELTKSQKKLYEMIWRHTLASQMQSAQLNQLSVEFTSADGRLKLRASGSQVVFAGYLKAFEDFDTGKEGSSGDIEEEEEEEEDGVGVRTQSSARRQEQERQARLLSNLKGEEPVWVQEVATSQHLSKAAPRYTEAQLVKTLQQLGIGRPSTYAPVISVLQERGYVVKEGRALRATSRGRVLSAFLQQYFAQYVDYEFTSDMESQLDDVAGGKMGHAAVLRQFWPPFDAWVQASKDVSVRDIVDVLDTSLAAHLFRPSDGQTEAEARACPACTQRAQQGRLGLKLSKSGGFIGCSNYPDCSYLRPLELQQDGGMASFSSPKDQEALEAFPGLSEGPVSLGRHPDTNEDIFVRQGRYGPYLQLGTMDSPSAVRQVAKGIRRSANKKAVTKLQRTARTGALKDVNLQELDLAKAVELLQWPLSLGDHPALNQPILLNHSKFGYYVQAGNVKASLPTELQPDKVDLHQACQLLDAKASALAKGQASSADQQLQGNSADNLHGLHESKFAADNPDKQFSKAESKAVRKAGRNAGSQRPSLKGRKQSKSADATKGMEDKAKQRNTQAGKSAVQKGTVSDKKPKTVSADKVSSEGTSSSPPKSRYRLFWRQQWAKLRIDHPSITMTDANKLISQDWKQLDDRARQTYQ
ncbi:hypothetical protein WJX77_011670 [Trebouxia sp. C0004]